MFTQKEKYIDQVMLKETFQNDPFDIKLEDQLDDCNQFYKVCRYLTENDHGNDMSHKEK
jgi:hypothetical protein